MKSQNEIYIDSNVDQKATQLAQRQNTIIKYDKCLLLRWIESNNYIYLQYINESNEEVIWYSSK